MNTNFLRTILNGLTGATFTSILTTIAGCKGDDPLTPVVEAATCSAAWIPLQYQAMAGLVFVVIGFLFKMFGGTGATPAQNLAAPVVPVVATKAEASVGVVTKAQVAEPGPTK